MPKGEFEKFPYKSIKALPVGIDINIFKSLFHYKVLENQLQFCKENKEVTKAIQKCMGLFKTPFNIIKESAAWSAESDYYVFLKNTLFDCIEETN